MMINSLKRALTQQRPVVIFFLFSVVFLLTFFLIVQVDIRKNNDLKRLFLYDAYQGILVEQINSSSEQIANDKEVSLFLQQSDFTKTKTKATVIKNIREIIVTNKLIEGAQLLSVKKKELLTIGETSGTFLTYSLSYINDYRNPLGKERGFLKIYVNTEITIDTIEKYANFNISMKKQDQRIMTFLFKENPLFTIEGNKIIYLENVEGDYSLLIAFSTILLLLFLVFSIIFRREMSKATLPIKKIDDIVKQKQSSDFKFINFNPDININIIVEIVKIQNNILQLLEKAVEKNMIQFEEQHINEIHKIKSNISAIKLAINSHIDVKKDIDTLSQNLAHRLKSRGKNINPPKNTINIFLIKDLLQLIKNKTKESNILHLTLEINKSSFSKYVRVNVHEISNIIDNIINNSKESHSKNLYLLVREKDQSISISFIDDGRGAEKNIDVFSGSFNKSSGTGIGLSSAKNYLKKVKGKIIRLDTNIGFGLELELEKFSNHIYEVVRRIREDLLIANIIYFGNKEHATLEGNVTCDISYFERTNELIDFLSVSHKAKITPYQLLIIELDSEETDFHRLRNIVVEFEMANRAIYIDTNSSKLYFPYNVENL